MGQVDKVNYGCGFNLPSYEDVMKPIEDTVMFPTRYLGSKTGWSLPEALYDLVEQIYYAVVELFTGIPAPQPSKLPSGYHWNLKDISPQDARNFVRHCAVAVASFGCDESWIQPYGMRILNPQQSQLSLDGIAGNLEKRDNCYFDRSTGLKIVITEGDDEVLISFGAKHAASHLVGEEEADKLNSNIQNIAIRQNFGGEPEEYEVARQFIHKLKEHPEFRYKSIKLVGQCFAGSVAQYVGIAEKVETVVFNSLSMGAGLHEKLGRERLSEADRYVTHISARGDYTSDFPGIHIIDRILCFLGIRTPGNFGKRFAIPSAYYDRAIPLTPNEFDGTHKFIFGSLMKYIDNNRNRYTVRSKPADLLPEDLIRPPRKPSAVQVEVAVAPIPADAQHPAQKRMTVVEEHARAGTVGSPQEVEVRA